MDSMQQAPGSEERGSMQKRSLRGALLCTLSCSSSPGLTGRNPSRKEEAHSHLFSIFRMPGTRISAHIHSNLGFIIFILWIRMTIR